MPKKYLVFFFIAGLTGFIYAQAVTFQSPVPWMTLREKTIIAKTLIDTAEVKTNSVTLTLFKVENGKEKQVVSQKIKTVDFSQECELAAIENTVLGGSNYFKIEWQVIGTDKRGIVEPFGMIILPDDDAAASAIPGKMMSGKLTAAAMKVALKESDYISVGAGKVGLVWNKDKFGIVCKNIKGLKSISFAIDGKNGKNAFLSFADRIATYYPANDSMSAVYYKRVVRERSVNFDSNPWKQEIIKDVAEDMVLIAIPWYDCSIIPSEGRIFGFAVIAVQDEKTTVALPVAAQKEIPGTWGNVVLKK